MGRRKIADNRCHAGHERLLDLVRDSGCLTVKQGYLWRLKNVGSFVPLYGANKEIGLKVAEDRDSESRCSGRVVPRQRSGSDKWKRTLTDLDIIFAVDQVRNGVVCLRSLIRWQSAIIEAEANGGTPTIVIIG